MSDSTLSLPIIEGRYGRVCYLPNDDLIGKSLALYGEWAEKELEFLFSFVGLGSVVVEVGANIGTRTPALSRRVGSRGSVIVFEAQPLVFKILRSNLELNGCTNVTVHQVGIGRGSTCHARSNDRPSGPNQRWRRGPRARGADGLQVEKVEITSLDAFSLKACDLIRIDAESIESAVISGMRQTVERLRPIIYLECNSIAVGAESLRSAAYKDYEMFFVRTAAYNSNNYRHNQENFLGWAMESGLLLAPRERRHLIPAPKSGVEVISITTLDELAKECLATPRYGDLTPYDRNPGYLLAQLQTMQANRDEEVKRLKFRVASLEKQFKDHEEQLAKVGEVPSAAIELSAVYASTSWRVTKPIRQLKQAFLILRSNYSIARDLRHE
jgi:FkbM family methyltransferase